MKAPDRFWNFDAHLKNQLFIGRARELDLLKRSIFEKKDKVVAISGNNATGKTSLWNAFLRVHSGKLNNKTEVVSILRSDEEFPPVENDIELVIIEDLSLDITLSLEGKITDFINRYPRKQFILVGAFKNFLDKFEPAEHIHLEVLPSDESVRFLLNFLSRKLPEKDLVKISRMTQGNPYLLKLVANYINENKYDLSSILELITQNINYQSFFDGRAVSNIEQTPEFIQVSSDIRVVNQSILERMKYNPDAMYHLSPRQFEEMVAELMVKRGYQVDLTKATRDGGKDLIIASHVDIGNFMYYVECKRYAPTNPVGVNLVRELVGTISADRVTAGIMITSSYYSPDAVEFSEKFRHQLSLIDFIKLKEWMANCR
ncbi:Restriction endonuclease [Marinobacter daqiaonensis]|uniref:Restriction endonuclease n=1 Tax=Marinobacter daqiaonensis TaxID=650891 RepID=A0A1I6I9Y3_9GAMM|nr:restriction endonuclease [Marinobacter daqiaonensis]SFR63562.1 Restriction endonuclease [Marinobacter daqiaonensis]